MAFPDSNARAGEKLWGTCVSTQTFGIIQRVDRGNTKSTGQQLCETLRFMSQYCIVLSTHLMAENSSLSMSFLAHEGLQILVISSEIGRPCKIPSLSFPTLHINQKWLFQKNSPRHSLVKMKQSTSWWLPGSFSACLGRGPFRVTWFSIGSASVKQGICLGSIFSGGGGWLWRRHSVFACFPT